MRVLIAGSSGFLGSALQDELRRAGHDVHTLVRRAARTGTEHTWDPPAGTISPGALDGVDAVVNLCGASLNGRWSAARKQEIRDSRIEPTEVLAEAVAQHGVPTLVNASGINYYGNTGDVVVDESAGEGAGFLAELCDDWERAADPARKAGVRVVVLRTGLVLGRGGLLQVLKPVFWLGLGGRLGEGRQYMPWIGLADEIKAIRFVLENQAIAGPVNLCSPNPVTNAEFTKALAKAVSRPALLFVPKIALRVVLGEAAEELALSGVRARPTVLTDAGFDFTYTDIDAALSDAV